MAEFTVETNTDGQTPETEVDTIVDNQEQPPEGDPLVVPEVDPASPEENPEGDEDPNTDLGDKLADNQKATEDTVKLLTDKGINFDTLNTEFTEKGALSEETYTQLEEAGFPKSVVNAYIAGQEALANQFTDAVVNYAGGKDGYAQATKFIQAEGAEAIKAYNSLVDSGNLPAIKMYLEGVQAKLTLRNGTSNPSIIGGASTAQVGGYESPTDMMKAMNDERYGKDEKFTNEVQTKMSKSAFIKFNR